MTTHSIFYVKDFCVNKPIRKEPFKPNTTYIVHTACSGKIGTRYFNFAVDDIIYDLTAHEYNNTPLGQKVTCSHITNEGLVRNTEKSSCFIDGPIIVDTDLTTMRNESRALIMSVMGRHWSKRYTAEQDDLLTGWEGYADHNGVYVDNIQEYLDEHKKES